MGERVWNQIIVYRLKLSNHFFNQGKGKGKEEFVS